MEMLLWPLNVSATSRYQVLPGDNDIIMQTMHATNIIYANLLIVDEISQIQMDHPPDYSPDELA